MPSVTVWMLIVTHLMGGGIFHYRFITDLLLSLSVKEFWKSVSIWQTWRQKYSGIFFSRTRCRVPRLSYDIVCIGYVILTKVTMPLGAVVCHRDGTLWPWGKTMEDTGFMILRKILRYGMIRSQNALSYLTTVQYEWMNEWKCEDFKCIWKPTESRLCLTHYVNKSSRWAKNVCCYLYCIRR